MHLHTYSLILHCTCTGLRLTFLTAWYTCRLRTLQDLTEHISERHNVSTQINNIHFQTLDQFLDWKKEEERKTNSQYVQLCSSQVYGKGEHWYYYCHCSGHYKPKGKEKRQTKAQGSFRTGNSCTAHIKAVRDLTTGEVMVQYCSTHNSHSISLGHSRIPSDTRMKIASKLHQGVSIERILDDIRDNIDDSISCEHLVTRQDIRNIKTQYNVDGISRHKDNPISVNAWVEEMMSLPYNPVLFYKPQGTTDPNGNLADNDFLLVIQTEFMRDMFSRFGNNAVCMDTTHGTNAYDFNLITAVVIDEYGEGIPVMWAISNRQDTDTLITVLRAVEMRSGQVTPRWFTSDDAQQFFNAWETVFGTEGCNKLLCAWHLDRSWRCALNNLISNVTNRLEVYHHLRVLLQERNEADFRVLLQQFLAFVEESQPSFAAYFKANYSTRIMQWAPCYRHKTAVNTNMFLETFHRLVKVVYLHKQNRRLDHLIVTLMKIARDKTFERLCKVEKGKNSHRISQINKRHKAAMQMKSSYSQLEDNTGWKIASEQLKGVNYTVLKEDQQCNCKMKCASCRVCIHMYSCMCMDVTIHTTVCKHIHFIKMALLQQESPQHSQPTEHQDMEKEPNYFSQVLSSSSTPSPTKTPLQASILRLQELVQLCVENEVLKTALVHVKAAVSILETRDKFTSSTLQAKRLYPPNVKCQKQRRF